VPQHSASEPWWSLSQGFKLWKVHGDVQGGRHPPAQPGGAVVGSCWSVVGQLLAVVGSFWQLLGSCAKRPLTSIAMLAPPTSDAKNAADRNCASSIAPDRSRSTSASSPAVTHDTPELCE
jgi:hypothetical protein